MKGPLAFAVLLASLPFVLAADVAAVFLAEVAKLGWSFWSHVAAWGGVFGSEFDPKAKRSGSC